MNNDHSEGSVFDVVHQRISNAIHTTGMSISSLIRLYDVYVELEVVVINTPLKIDGHATVCLSQSLEYPF